MLLVVPADPLRPCRPDEYFADEAEAAEDLGFAVACLDHAAAEDGGEAVLSGAVPDGERAVYRGWMLRPRAYAMVCAHLAARGVEMCTTPAAYGLAHELPGWYDTFRDLTPQSAWQADGSSLDDVLAALPAGPAVVKDHVKSMKHAWDEAMFIPDVRDLDAARAVVDRFLALRGDDLVGGVVVRRFEAYEPGEYRTWWVGGRHVLTTPHPDDPARTPPDIPLDDVAAAVARLGAWFVTVDMARTVDGRWRVVEVGDGQVSDRPRTVEPAALLAAIR